MIRLERYEKNPILGPIRENEWESTHVSNAGATIHDGEVYLLYRAEGKKKRRHNDWPAACLGLAVSNDGYNFSYRSKAPVLKAQEPYDAVEDPRITKIGDTYYIIYVITSIFNDRIGLAITKDFKNISDKGLIMSDISQRTSGLFPEKINGEYVLMHRILPNIWLSYSKDLKEWHNSKMIVKTTFGQWDEVKIGIGTPPIKTKNAWVLFYHGKDRHHIYRLGIAWLDLKDPSKVIKQQKEPILEPEMRYEKKGFIPNVVYTCGAVEKNNKILVYYGCCDSVLSVATINRDDIEL